MKVYKSPVKYPKKGIKLFLGGSIEMGSCDDWQEELTELLKDVDGILLNPRRDDFDVTQEQSINNTYFKKQVDWELNALEDADLIVMYLDPNTKAPISMLELGLFKDKRMLVCCPEGFWRKGNIEIVCNRYDLTLFHTKEKLFKYCKDILE